MAQALEARAAAPDGLGVVVGRAGAKLVSTYFDTPDRALARQGLTMRVRQRNGHFLQTVKSTGADGIVASRGEWEDATTSAAPDPQAAHTGRFLPATLVERLVPQFRTEISRRTIELRPAPDTRIEAAIDRGRLYAPARDASEAVNEVELELKSGSAAALFDVALELLAVAPVRLELRSKAERGYHLAAAEATPVAPAHAAPVDLEPGLSGDEALRCIGTACIDQILGNEAAVLAGEPEGVHQMRVAVRRLRAVLTAFAKLLPADQRRRGSDELRWLANALGAARNLDVFEKSLLAAAPAAGAEPAGLEALREALSRRQKAAYAEAKKAVRSTRYTGLLLRLLRWFEGCDWRGRVVAQELKQPIGSLAVAILDRRQRKVKRGSDGFARQSAKQRHRLRIALKQQRYAIEVLGTLYPQREVGRFTERLKRLQDDLGDANDLRVGRDILAALAMRAGKGEALAAAGKSALDWQERRLASHEPRLRKRLDRLLDAEPFWQR